MPYISYINTKYATILSDWQSLNILLDSIYLRIFEYIPESVLEFDTADRSRSYMYVRETPTKP